MNHIVYREFVYCFFLLLLGSLYDAHKRREEINVVRFRCSILPRVCVFLVLWNINIYSNIRRQQQFNGRLVYRIIYRALERYAGWCVCSWQLFESIASILYPLIGYFIWSMIIFVPRTNSSLFLLLVGFSSLLGAYLFALNSNLMPSLPIFIDLQLTLCRSTSFG